MMHVEYHVFDDGVWGNWLAPVCECDGDIASLSCVPQFDPVLVVHRILGDVESNTKLLLIDTGRSTESDLPSLKQFVQDGGTRTWWAI